VGTAEEMSDAVTRSRLPDGRVVGWYGDPGVVVDGELTGAEPPPHLARCHGVERFWERWTASECQAKLADTPLVIWLASHALGSGPAHVVTFDGLIPGVTLSIGRA
jgi:hypothetical protein